MSREVSERKRTGNSYCCPHLLFIYIIRYVCVWEDRRKKGSIGDAPFSLLWIRIFKHRWYIFWRACLGSQRPSLFFGFRRGFWNLELLLVPFVGFELLGVRECHQNIDFDCLYWFFCHPLPCVWVIVVLGLGERLDLCLGVFFGAGWPFLFGGFVLVLVCKGESEGGERCDWLISSRVRFDGEEGR